MPSSYLYIGLSAIRAFQLALDNTGQNIANANTPGFSRRRIQLQAARDGSDFGNYQAQGVKVNSITRERDSFLDFAYRREISRLGADEARSNVLKTVEPLFGSPDDSPLQEGFSRLFNSFESAITLNPAGARQEIVAAATNAARTVQNLEASLTEQRFLQNNLVRETVDRVNELSAEIAALNRSIGVDDVQVDQASSLRDRRDLLADELSELVGARAVPAGNGTISIFLEGTGDALVTGTTSNALLTSDDANGLLQISIDRGGATVDLTGKIRTGKLGGLIVARDEQVGGYLSQLDQLTQSLITEINALHTSGFDANGNPGLPLFLPDPATAGASSTIELNPAIAADPSLIALSGAAGESGNFAIAEAIAGLRSSDVTSLGGTTFIDFVAGIISDAGRDLQSIEIDRASSQTIVESIETQRQAATGVSLDEEAANLVIYQQAYQASAQFMQTVNRVTELTFNLLAR